MIKGYKTSGLKKIKDRKIDSAKKEFFFGGGGDLGKLNLAFRHELSPNQKLFLTMHTKNTNPYHRGHSQGLKQCSQGLMQNSKNLDLLIPNLFPMPF